MIHKTLNSYHNNLPHDEDQEHPDGQLWLIGSQHDWDMLPHGVVLEHAKTGKPVVYNSKLEKLHNVYGIRGYRE